MSYRNNRSHSEWITSLLANFLLILIGGWELMLAVGIAHHEWLPMLPMVDYGTAVLLVALLRAAFVKVDTSRSDR